MLTVPRRAPRPLVQTARRGGRVRRGHGGHDRQRYRRLRRRLHRSLAPQPAPVWLCSTRLHGHCLRSAGRDCHSHSITSVVSAAVSDGSFATALTTAAALRRDYAHRRDRVGRCGGVRVAPTAPRSPRRRLRRWRRRPQCPLRRRSLRWSDSGSWRVRPAWACWARHRRARGRRGLSNRPHLFAYACVRCVKRWPFHISFINDPRGYGMGAHATDIARSEHASLALSFEGVGFGAALGEGHAGGSSRALLDLHARCKPPHCPVTPAPDSRFISPRRRERRLARGSSLRRESLDCALIDLETHGCNVALGQACKRHRWPRAQRVPCGRRDGWASPAGRT